MQSQGHIDRAEKMCYSWNYFEFVPCYQVTPFEMHYINSFLKFYVHLVTSSWHQIFKSINSVPSKHVKSIITL